MKDNIGALRVVAALGLVLIGCDAQQPTEIVLAISSEFGSPNEIDLLRISAQQDGRSKFAHEYQLGVSTRPILPGTLTLVAGDSPEEPVTIIVTGMKDGKTVVQQSARLAWIRGRTLLLRIFLTRNCAHVTCAGTPESTCRSGRCVSIDVKPELLPEYTADAAVAPLDSGAVDMPHDAESDTPPADAGVDSGAPDAGVDSGAPGTWVSISDGTFTMGSPTSEPCRDLKEDTHQVTLTRAFELQATEVTQGQFESLMGYNPSYFGPDGDGADCGADCPVEMVNWHEAVAYCNALSDAKGYAKCYDCSGSGESVTCYVPSTYSGQAIYTCPGYRLPTEAEWEYAYRAGTQTAYYNGDKDPGACSCSTVDTKADAIGWYCANSGDTTHPVGQKQANQWGLYDMGGNVWEWCHDWYQSLGSSATTDPAGPTTGSFRVGRGGSWSDTLSDVSDIRAAIRIAVSPEHPDPSIGFRCARTPQP